MTSILRPEPAQHAFVLERRMGRHRVPREEAMKARLLASTAAEVMFGGTATVAA
jgi:hypothetical protein